MQMGHSDFRYRREDFGELPVILKHLDIYLNFLENEVEAENILTIEAKQELNRIFLDAADLEIIAIELIPPMESQQAMMLDHSYDRSAEKLEIKLPRTIRAGEAFRIRTLTRCVPSDSHLEGIYRDVTPPGAPQQFISQCQQWGFRRIMPIYDDCCAKCTMRTTLEGDAAYTHLISNGNIDRESNPEGRPVPKPGSPGRKTITFNNPVPMAPYLFIACAGTWDSLEDQLTYPNGRSVKLEYLVPPGRSADAMLPMRILKESILWVFSTQGYEYTGDTYRTICMTRSNYGGMENVGNTTIVTDAALVNEYTLDSTLLYAHAVIVHEFEHNQCGSETTMETPFDVWLNEAYTVDVERQFMADQFDPSFVRLNQVDAIRNPLLGPLAIEDGAQLGRIVRDGFNDTEELIDGVTYVKAAEVIRMLRLLLGSEVFRAGKSLYFSRYRYANANTDEFFQCFEEVSGRSLDQFKNEWLYRIGYPKVTIRVDTDWHGPGCRISFTQESPRGTGPFVIPIKLALVDPSGTDIEGTQRTFELNQPQAELVLDSLPRKPAFGSFNRDYSFYGSLTIEDTGPETLSLQAVSDPNFCNRVEAMRQLTDRERIRLLNDPNSEPGSAWVSLYGSILKDRSVAPSIRAYLLRIDEQPLERSYSVLYPELVAAREKLMLVINSSYRPHLLEHYRACRSTLNGELSLARGIEERMLSHVLLDLCVIDDSAESHQLIFDALHHAGNVTDTVSALLALNRSSAPERKQILEDYYGRWSPHLSAYANYLRIVSSGTRDDVFEMIQTEKRRPTFDITQPTWCRALFLPMAVNNKMVWTDQGISWVAETVIELAKVNTTTGSRLLNTFQHVQRLRPDLKRKVIEALEHIVGAVPPEVSRTINAQAAGYLRSSAES